MYEFVRITKTYLSGYSVFRRESSIYPTFPIQTKERTKDLMKVFTEFLLTCAESMTEYHYLTIPSETMAL